MNNQEKSIKKFLASFQDVGGRFHVLENRVPVEIQIEYFDYSSKLRKRKTKLKENDYDHYKEMLEDVDFSHEEKKKLLSTLALSAEVRAYRLLEYYMKQPDDELVNWASMALMECRVAIESELSDEKKIYISSGLGGKMGKVRFYALVSAQNRMPFEDYQREVIEKEFNYYFSKNDCDIERLTIKDNYLELVFLIPFTSNLRKIIVTAVSECNIYGNFLSQFYSVTNVKVFSQDEVDQTLAKLMKDIKQN